ncbi:very short patch repair endonuclease [Terasakiella sp.]|uniref:very short patch repair endonuclease n=1 Tax=Terasakiella sp. TaxID=2034861 RepID=UPI003AA92D06
MISRSENMRRIRGSNTTIEVILRKELWARGLRYRKNCKTIIGKPDIAFPGKKIAVFCDSEFWHGKKYLEGEIPKHNRAFWVAKLERNILRDKEVNKQLLEYGWLVLRFWERDIRNNLSEITDKIEEAWKAR